MVKNIKKPSRKKKQVKPFNINNHMFPKTEIEENMKIDLENARSVDIINTKPGDLVIYNGDDGTYGMFPDARKFLVKGLVYTIATIEPGDDTTTITLVDVPGIEFNSVIFVLYSPEPETEDSE